MYLVHDGEPQPIRSEVGRMHKLLWNPEHWENRAEEARAVAAMFNDKTARMAMLEVASSYDALARLSRSRVNKEMRQQFAGRA